MLNYNLVQLSSKTKVSDFDCGNQDLNEFIQEDALKNQNIWLSVTMTLEGDDGSLLGFYTITPDTLHKGRIDITDKIAEYPYQKYPAIKLARLAVDKRYQGKGIGDRLMKEFFMHAWKFAMQGGGRFITVDAKNTAVSFYKLYDFRAVSSHENEEIVPMYLDFYKSYFGL